MKILKVLYLLGFFYPVFSEIFSSIQRNNNFNGVVWTGYLNEDANEQVAYFQIYQTNSLKLFVFVGSPGYSTQLFNFRGMGPQYLNDTLQRVENQYDYSQSAQLWFVDILGAGYSRWPGTIKTLQMSEYVDYFVRYLQFSFNSFWGTPEDWKKFQIYFIGSGWGAQVATYVAEKFQNSKVILLSPMLSPRNLLSQLGSLGYSLGLLDQQERSKIEGIVSAAVFAGVSKPVFDEVINLLAKYSGNMQVTNYLKYDMNLDELKLSFFFNQGETKEIMNVLSDQTFFVHNFNVTNALVDEFSSEQSIQKISTMIDAKKTIAKFMIIFNSLSLRLNYPGTLLSLDQLNWGKSNSLNKVTAQYFKQTGDDYDFGWYKVIDTLQVFNIFDSGENIWQDQPAFLYSKIIGF